MCAHDHYKLKDKKGDKYFLVNIARLISLICKKILKSAFKIIKT